MGKKQKYIIWVGAVLLLAMLACIYVSIDKVYSDVQPNIPAAYRTSALTP